MDSDEEYDEDEGEVPQSRARDLLANFYGHLQSVPSDAEDEPIDRADFDADAHVRSMLKTKQLGELLATDDELCRDVKNLSGEMQMLVYENYSKFISATDTIRDMKVNVGAMEDEMTALTTTMSEIDSMSSAVNSSLADKRAQIDKLVRARRLLKRLEFLFELPRKLHAAIAARAYDDAVKYFTVTDKILTQYAHVPSLAEIHLEAKHIVASLERELLASLRARAPSLATTPSELVQRVELLGTLGSDCDECEVSAFRCVERHLTEVLEAAAKAADAAPTVGARARALGEAFVPRFVACAAALREISRATTLRNSAPPYDEQQRDESAVRPNLSALATELFDRYLICVERCVGAQLVADAPEEDQDDLASPRDDLDETDAASAAARETAAALALVQAGVAEGAAACEDAQLDAALQLDVAGIARRVAVKRLDARFAALRRQALEGLSALAWSLDEASEETCLVSAGAAAAAHARAIVDALATRARKSGAPRDWRLFSFLTGLPEVAPEIQKG